MAQSEIQPRDIELLRTLARLRYVTSREINRTFFSHDRPARRRLEKLSARDYIAPHSKGLAPRCSYSAWRLTARGLSVVERHYPLEPVPDGLVERLMEASLQDLEHREALSRVYLELIGGDAPTGGDESNLEMRLHIATLAQRASQLVWQPDGDVELRYAFEGRTHVLVPDATVISPGSDVRVFVELDRSNKTLTRIAQNVEQYKVYFRDVYATAFADGRKPILVYVLQSESRRRGVSRVLGRVLDPGQESGALLVGQTTAWLERRLGLPEGNAPAVQSHVRTGMTPTGPAGDLVSAAGAVLEWTNALLVTLKARGLLELIRKDDTGFLSTGKQKLMRLNAALATEEHHGG
jgi:hypothetical protein